MNDVKEPFIMDDILQNNWRPKSFVIKSTLKSKKGKAILEISTGLVPGDIFCVKGDSVYYYIKQFTGFDKLWTYQILRLDKIAMSTVDEETLQKGRTCLMGGFLK